MPRRAVALSQAVTLDVATDLYCATFGRDALPCLNGLENDEAPVAAAMLACAVRTKRPLRYCAIADALGKPQPPQGGSL